MYSDKKGLYVLKSHIERLQSNGQNPWVMFSDNDVIKDIFGKLALEWAKQQKRKEIKEFLRRLETISTVKDVMIVPENNQPNKELIDLDQVIVSEVLGYSVDKTGKVAPAITKAVDASKI